MEESFQFDIADIDSAVESFSRKGITEFVLQDEQILSHKGRLLYFLRCVREKAPDVFVTLPVDASVLDMDVCRCCAELCCSIEILLDDRSDSGTYLFDKQFFSRRAKMLNTLGLVFGFDMDFARSAEDRLKFFRERVDFAVSLYPNHIDFPQIESGSGAARPAPSAVFSTQDIEAARELAFACSSFYSFGRAVPWFLSVLAPLGMKPSQFFRDFAEWQNINNCGLNSKWRPDSASHSEIERMQLSFLKFKYEEKSKSQLFDVVSCIVRLHGAFSRCIGENEESIVRLSYNPDELFGGGAQDIQSFFDNAFIENSSVRVFMGVDGPDFRYC